MHITYKQYEAMKERCERSGLLDFLVFMVAMAAVLVLTAALTVILQPI